MVKIGVVSAGSWGTALAGMLSGKQYDTVIWAREPEIVESINSEHENKLFMPGIKLPESLRAVADIKDAVSDKDLVVIATPAQHIRKSFEQIAGIIPEKTFIVLASKGIENSTLKMMYQIAEEILPEKLHKNIFVISGPTFARELAMKMPTCAVVAGKNAEDIGKIRDFFNSPYMRIYTSSDVIGVELGGSLKNVFAVAIGVLEGLKMGKNTQAAVITRSIAEMTRLVIAMGGDPRTMAGLSGVGDLVLTCTGDLSRNRQVGIRLGQGEKIKDIIDSMIMVAEGVPTTASAHDLAAKMNVEMPITETLYNVLYNGEEIRESIKKLMSRSLKDELLSYGGEND